MREDISKQQAIDRILAKHQELIRSTDRSEFGVSIKKQIKIMYRNKKTGDLYQVIVWGVIDATNGQEDRAEMVLYKNLEGQPFVREEEEFLNKFEEVELKDF